MSKCDFCQRKDAYTVAICDGCRDELHAAETYHDLLYRLVIKKDGTARIEAEALLKGER